MRHSTPGAEAVPDPDVGVADHPAQSGMAGAFQLSARARAGLMVWALLAIVWVFTLPRQAPRGGFGEYRLPAPRAPQGDRQAIVGLQSAALDRQSPVFEPRRNIFAFASLPVAHRVEQKDPRQRKVEQGGTTSRQAPRDPPLDVAFLGVFGPEHLRIAVLKDRGGKSVSNLLERDVVEDRYRVLEIEPESILLQDTSAPSAPPIRLEHP